MTRRGFASDNAAAVHPEVLAAITAANVGHAFGYGHDPVTERVNQLFAEHFGSDARTLLVFNGSGANVLCLRATCRPWEGVICAQSAHINVDECGAPEAIAGVKLLPVPTADGKLTPELVESRIERLGDEHAVQPRLVSISQCTELGTVYTADELAALATCAHDHGMLLHLDGARLANAAAALRLSLRGLSTDAGVDIISFGGTKNGLLGGEAVVVLNPALAPGIEYLRKQTLQLASKMRFLAAQFEALLSDELWLRCASQANLMAARLGDLVKGLPGLELVFPVQSNAVFVRVPPATAAALHESFDFYDWNRADGVVRWMCSWDTTEEDVESFASVVREALGWRRPRSGASASLQSPS